MTDPLEDLARIVVTLPGWRWMAGMLAERWTGPCHGSRRVTDGEARAWLRDPAKVWPRGVPDLSDPATVGCVRALVEEACGGPVSINASGPTVTAWSRSRQGHGPTRIEALVALWQEVSRG